MKKSTPVIVLLLALSFILAACGAGGSSGSSKSIDAKMSDFKFTPDTWTVPAGQEITLNLTNDGAVTHDWSLVLVPAGQTLTDADKSNSVAEFTLEPGKTEVVSFTAPADPGEYQVICAIPGHTEAGMVGKLIVQ